ncbi:DeoR/GlpR transcriptional regulator [Bacillaceae bacterium Marseille-Q3522]|nr:DeoR/GlpR transcriptional regulator [Bacillaceae bacterium Marseille-Q3522]
MYADQRRNKILEIIKEKETVSVNELTELLNFSAATVRSDLNQMEKQGLLIRTHGGAMLKEQGIDVVDKKYEHRQRKFREEKSRIGSAAFQYIQEGQCILLDASSTCFELARYIADSNMKLTVVTSGIATAEMLKECPNLTVIIIGGIVRSASNSVEGLLGYELLRKINIDILFTSAYAFNLKDGLTDFSLYEVELKREMAAATNKIIALLDHSKINKTSIATFAQTDEIDTLITDVDVSSEIREYFTFRGKTIEIAESPEIEK